MEGDWKINSYENKFEPDEQWEMRKIFVEATKHLFSEDRVVCLAQVLVNMEILGTKYPIETMRAVIELSREIIDEFKERQKTRLQRTVVGGTDAACAKEQDFRVRRIRNRKENDIIKRGILLVCRRFHQLLCKRETPSKQEPNSKLNPSPVVSNKDESETKFSSRKGKKAWNIEKTTANNFASTECVTWSSSQAPGQLEGIVEPIRKKKIN